MINITHFSIFSLPFRGSFSPFPHGTCSLSLLNLYLGFEEGSPIFNKKLSIYFNNKINHNLNYRSLTFYAIIFQKISFKLKLIFILSLIRFRSPLLTESRLISIALVNEMVHFTRYIINLDFGFPGKFLVISTKTFRNYYVPLNSTRGILGL
jgi:hypothetical protein